MSNNAESLRPYVGPRVRARRRRESRRRGFAVLGLFPRGGWLVAAAVMALGLAVTYVAAADYARNEVVRIDAAGPVLARSVVIYDRYGAVLAERNQEGTFHVTEKLGEMGKYAPAATLAAEDRDFYKHGALNPLALTRAMVVDTVGGKPIEGGSTITQQLVKIMLGNNEKTLPRKVNEALVANEMEKRHSKDDILADYLNRVYYGHGAYGIGAASKTYFGKSTRDLTIAQAALLAGLLQAPNTNDPQLHFQRARSRQLYVLDQMYEAHMIKAAERTAARAEDVQKELVYDVSFRQTRAPHFVDYVMQRLETQFGPAAIQEGGLAVHTTLDPGLQAQAEQAVVAGVRAMAGQGVNNGMLLAAKPDTGEILAWVGSADYGNQGIGGQFDVILSPRQPGSSFKPYVYEAALKSRKISLASCLADRPTDFGGGYKPLDFDNSYMGNISARTALVQSRNIPAVAVAQKEGIQNVISLATSMGIRSQLQPVLATAIGASEVTMLDHVQGYSVFANQGKKVPLMSITLVTDASGAKIYSQPAGQQPGQGQVLAADEAYLLTDVLKDYQNAWHLGFGRQMASKSGTSGGSQLGVHQDAWMMAYNPNIVIGTWAGNTAAGGGGQPVSAFGVNTGQSMLAQFLNNLPPQWNSWYPRPADLASRKGELFLPLTESMSESCAGNEPSDGQGDNRFQQGGGGEHHHHGHD